jgi:hypothetical protein
MPRTSMAESSAIDQQGPLTEGLEKRSGTRPRIFVAVLAIIALAIAAYFTIASLAGKRDSRILTETVAPENRLAALKLLPPKELQRLIAREAVALRDNPLDQAALKNLTLLLRATDDPQGAERLAILAGARSLRDLRAQAEVLDILLARKDFAAALYRLDALLRAQPERSNELLSIAALFAESDESRPALVAALAANPPWRPAFLSMLVERAKSPATSYGVLASLRDTASPPTAQELRQLLTKLVANHDYDTAYFVWLDFLSEVDLRKAANIYDGGFELNAQNLVFGWNFDKLKNTDVRIVPRSTSSADRMLRVEFLNTRDRFAHVWQLLRLAPGLYDLAGETKADRLATEVGLVWRVYCLGDGERPIAATHKLFAASTWAQFETQFEIPKDDCPVQRLRLEVDSQAALDQLITGQIYFDNLQIRARH